MNEKPTLEIIAPTVEEALAQGLAQLGLPAEAVSMEVLDAGTKGLFGLGGRQVRVRLTIKSDEEIRRSHINQLKKTSSFSSERLGSFFLRYNSIDVS